MDILFIQSALKIENKQLWCSWKNRICAIELETCIIWTLLLSIFCDLTNQVQYISEFTTSLSLSKSNICSSRDQFYLLWFDSTSQFRWFIFWCEVRRCDSIEKLWRSGCECEQKPDRPIDSHRKWQGIHNSNYHLTWFEAICLWFFHFHSSTQLQIRAINNL